MPRPYVRVYHEDLKRDYPSVWKDNDALSTWLRLLVLADKMWPEPAEMPRSVRPRVLAVLTKAGLVKLAPDHTFEVRGYASERSSRQDAARNAAASRWAHASAYADASANAHAETMPRPRPSTEYRDSLRENGGNSRGGKPEKVGMILPKVLR